MHIIFGYVAGPSRLRYLGPKRFEVPKNSKKYPNPENVKKVKKNTDNIQIPNKTRNFTRKSKNHKIPIV